MNFANHKISLKMLSKTPFYCLTMEYFSTLNTINDAIRIKKCIKLNIYTNSKLKTINILQI